MKAAPEDAAHAARERLIARVGLAWLSRQCSTEVSRERDLPLNKAEEVVVAPLKRYLAEEWLRHHNPPRIAENAPLTAHGDIVLQACDGEGSDAAVQIELNLEDGGRTGRKSCPRL